MRAITLTQPWAGLVAAGIKLVENRERSILAAARFTKPAAIHEPIAIHASREIDQRVYARIADIAPELFPSHTCSYSDQPWYRLSRITSAVLGVVVPRRVVRATGIVELVNGDGSDTHGYTYAPAELAELGEQRRWLFGRFGYVFDPSPRVLPTPVPCKGMLGCWTLPDAVAVQVEEQLR